MAYDWDHWRQTFVRGSDELDYKKLSEMPGAPRYQTILNRSRPTAENWKGQRQHFRRALLNQKADPTVAEVAAAAAVDAVETKIGLLVDTARLIEDALSVSRALIEMGAYGLKDLKPNELSPNDIARFFKLGFEIQYRAHNLDQGRISLELDLDSLTDADLDRLIGDG